MGVLKANQHDKVIVLRYVYAMYLFVLVNCQSWTVDSCYTAYHLPVSYM